MIRPEKSVSFSPGIYEHAAALIDESPYTVSRDATLLSRAQKAAWELYRHPLLVAGIDVYNVEPEALGATLNAPAGHGVPCVISHPVPSVEGLLDVESPNPQSTARMPMVLEAARRLVGECPGATVFVPVCGLLALANGLAGMDEVLCEMMEDQDLVAGALAHLAEIQGRYIRSILEAGAHPLIFESGASPPLLPPSFFSEIEAPALGRMFSICREAGDAAPHCILGGNVVPVLPELLAFEPGFLICPSETDQSLFVELAKNAPQVAVRINRPENALLTDDWEEARSAADAAHALAKCLPHATVGTGVVPIDSHPALILKLRNHIQSL